MTDKKIIKGTVAVVIAEYAYGSYQRGDIISRHKSYEAASKAAKGNSFGGIRFVDDIISQSGGQ